jgi:hypothetical protein
MLHYLYNKILNMIKSNQKEPAVEYELTTFNILNDNRLYSITNFKLLYYYQTMSSMDSLIALKNKTFANIYIYISSIHFELNKNKEPTIYINNDTPDNQGELWNDADLAHENGINILFMIGGAGGAYTNLFSDFEAYYKLLYDLLNSKRYIKGVDLDIEETVTIENVKMLITRLKKDFGTDFIVTMAPVASSLTEDTPGMGSFVYKDLFYSEEGKLINWFNVQSYGDYSFEVYNAIVNNGYSPDKIVFGMLGDEYDSNTISNASKEVVKIKTKYPTMGGCILWEYGDTKINPIEWGVRLL